jgi:2-polyprenyl-3-methyl-5-hydroxy-6-metoxy-1,4-benzoquinol methylase
MSRRGSLVHGVLPRQLPGPHAGDKQARILVISCGPGYLVKMLRDCGYSSVLGIDSDAAKVEVARRHQLPCEVARAFEFLADKRPSTTSSFRSRSSTT